MDKFIINGGNKLGGEVAVCKAKNSVLALLAASILTKEQVILQSCPKISDVDNMLKILEHLGAKTFWQGDNIIIDATDLKSCEIPSEYAKEIRSSIFLMGSICGRMKNAKAAFPGGCDIGLRPIDLHLKGLRALNIEIKDCGGYLNCNAQNARGGDVHLDFPSVGATENIIMAAVLIPGTTTLTNAAREPEIGALIEFLNMCGAKIWGAGTSTLTIQGVKKLRGVTFTPIPDRIVAGTFLLATAITGGKIKLNDCCASDMGALINTLDKHGGDISVCGNSITLKSYAAPKSVKLVETQPFPGFPTDLQPQTLALQCVSRGASVIVENMFETRFKYVMELIKMGADVTVRDRTAFVRGVKKLHGASVSAGDLRGGAALVLAALGAEGTSEISNVRHIDRGYYKLDEALSALGADIKRIITT